MPARALGSHLHEFRKQAGLSMAAAAQEIGGSVQTVRRAERGHAKPVTVAALCNLYKVPADMGKALLDLARQTKVPGWWHAYGDVVPSWFELYVSLEASAARIRTFEPLLVPGLLQTPDYMHAAIRAMQPDLTDEQVHGRVEVRRERQQILTRSFPAPPQLEIVIAEAVLLAGLPPGVMREQLRRLTDAAELPSVSVRILPLEVGPHRGSAAGAFAVLDFPAEKDHIPPSTVYGESQTGAIYLDKPREVDEFERIWESLNDVALSQADSIKKMSEMTKELEDRER